MISLINKYFQVSPHGFKNTFSLVSSNAVSKLIFSLGGIVLANYYGPSNYGEFNVFLSYANIFSLFLVISIDKIMLASNHYKEIRNLYNGIFIYILLVAAVATILLVATKDFVVYFEKMNLHSLIYSVIGGVLFAFILIQNTLFNKYSFYNTMAVGVIWLAVFIIFFQFVFYSLDYSDGLILGYLIGLFFTSLYFFLKSKSVLEKPDFKLFKAVLKKNKNILLYNFPSTLLLGLSQNILPVLILFYFGSSEVGEFSLAMKIGVLPVLILSYSISRVYFQKIAKMYPAQKRQIFHFSIRISLGNLLLLIISVFILDTVGVYLMNLLLHKDWSMMTLYLQYLSIYFIAKGMQETISQSFIVFHKNEYLLWFHIILLIAYAFCLYYGWKRNDFLFFVQLFSLGIGSLHFLFFFVTLGMIKINSAK